MIVVVPSSNVEHWSHSAAADAVVVCDSDGARAARAAEDVPDLRTAVYVGDLAHEEDRIHALEFACETFDVKEDEVLIALPN